MRPIDADELKKSIEEDEELKNNSLAYLLMNLMTCYIDDTPTLDIEPVRHGHWIICSDGYYPYCSKCKQEPDGKNMTNYCPNCGAIMDEVIE